MPFFTAIAAAIGASAASVGAAASLVGTVAGVAGQAIQMQGQRKAISAQKRAEALRQRQMDLESDRRRREIIRQQQMARAQAVATATAQGAADEGSSALAGAFGSIEGQTGRNIQAVNQNQEIGAGIFQANRDVTSAQGQAAFGGSISSFGQGLSSLGGKLIDNQKVINRVGGV